MFSKLEQMKKKGIDVSQVLQRSILNNWSDVYEPKVQAVQTTMERRAI